VQLGAVHTQIIGRAVVHAVNEDHCTVAPLRSLLDPLAALTETAAQIAGDRVEAVILLAPPPAAKPTREAISTWP
jgi:hypothetical protein